MIRRLSKEETIPMSLLLLADPSERLVLQYLKRGQCYVMEEEGVIIGVYVLLATRPDTVEIVNVAVEPDYQGKGLGKQLVIHAIDTARQQGWHTIEIGTGNSGVVQLALYQKCGFRITSIDRDFFLRHYEEPIMENGIQVVDMIRLSMDL
ncbi:GNAT family N-acetyltransferase [Gracilibacillus alcaliphilus]|uniref:GNAT family N-acetyltransferase n=1 Tax=Gracilibacillus alcaliphilus TaxID=1401441 RepID=UPI001958928D|nr:GNAT family N-acetyltransferase [Gracilibacillus alcaliphilus]MBM7676492.1 ribosomal protein S18 acetylase RimI-like enzyme [Gracilibacillus alcaliphilus]